MKHSEKIVSLQKHLERIRNQAANPSPKHKDRTEAYKSWIALEIKRTQKRIDSLKG